MVSRAPKALGQEGASGPQPQAARVLHTMLGQRGIWSPTCPHPEGWAPANSCRLPAPFHKEPE